MRHTKVFDQVHMGNDWHAPVVLQHLIGFFSPILRSFPIEIRGQENLPDGSAIYVCNHSNSHDIFIGMEVFFKSERSLTPFVAWDGLTSCPVQPLLLEMQFSYVEQKKSHVMQDMRNSAIVFVREKMVLFSQRARGIFILSGQCKN